MRSLVSATSLALQRIVRISGAASLLSSHVAAPTAYTLDVALSVGVAVATPDVFNDLPSGLRVESGDSLDLLSADDSILTSSAESGKGGASGDVDA